MKSKKATKIKFDLNEPDEPPPTTTTTTTTDNVLNNNPINRMRSLKFPFRKISVSKKLSNDETKISEQQTKQKIKLARYLSVEKPIIQNKVQIDDEERMLLDMLGNDRAIDLDQYFKFPELKAKNKLWKIPYKFSNNDDFEDDGDEQPKSINRFGEGVSDGCMIGLNLPKIYSKHQKQKFKTWNELLKTSGQIVDQFANNQSSRFNRRGSILQPRHVFLTPNPEIGCGEKFFLVNKNLTLRDWSSEIVLGTIENGELLNPDYRSNILRNVSINDLSNMIYPELKLSFIEYGMMSDSDMRYIQAVSRRRRQSLLPPNCSGESMSFRRQSFGGQLWSTEVENHNQRYIYQQKVALINPDYKPYSKRLNSITTGSLEFDPQNELDKEAYPYFDAKSNEQARLFAHELLLIVRKYFSSIKSSEIINFMTFTSQNGINDCAHIKGLLHFQNRIIRLIATYVLKEDQLELRVASILFFINVIRELHRLNNWHSVNLVTQSLQCPPVIRLKETWRKITFNHPEEYCFFIQISEDLAYGKQWETYELLTQFIPIFDDVIDMIKERCGLMIVQINQHRLHSTWGHLRDDDTVKWINDQVGSLKKDCPLLKSIEMPSGNNNNKQQQKSNNKNKSSGLLNRIFLNRRNSSSSKDGNNNNNNDNDDDDDNQLDDQPRTSDIITSPKMDNNENENIYQRRLLKGSNEIVIRRTAKTNRKNVSNRKGSLPSCKKFWSITEFYKLRPRDRNTVKQQMVRTLVNFQRKAFYVFEDRDETIKNFLLNAKCDTMDACMLRSRSIERLPNESRRVAAANRRKYDNQNQPDYDNNDDDDDGDDDDVDHNNHNNHNNKNQMNPNENNQSMINGHANQNKSVQQQQVVNNEPTTILQSESNKPTKRRVMFA